MAQDRTPYFAIALIAAVGALAFFAGTLLSSIQRHNSDIPDVAGMLWPDPPEIGEFELNTDSGSRFTKQDLLGRWTFMFFGFTQCPDVCPTSMQTLQQVFDRLKSNNSFAADGQVVFVSIDPERDTPEILAQYVRYFDEEFVGATAELARLKQFTSQLGIVFAKIKSPGIDGYTMDHSASILLIDPRGRLLGLYSLPHVVSDIAASFTQIRTLYGDGRL